MTSNQFTLRGTLVWAVCAVFFLYEFFLRTVIGTFQSTIMSDLQISTLEFSILSSSAYLLIYALMQIPVGLIVDHYGLKKSLLFASLVCAISLFGFASSTRFEFALFFRLLTGLGSAFGFVCLLVSVFEWLPDRHIALMIGASQFIGTLGPMLAAGPLNQYVVQVGLSWRVVFIYLSVVGLLLAVLVMLIVKNKPKTAGQYQILYRPENIVTSLKYLFRRFEPWAIGIYCALIYFSLEYLSENEGAQFIMLKGYSAQFSSYLITLSWFAYAIGCPLFGFLSDYFQRRKIFLTLGSILGIFAITLIVYGYNSVQLMTGFFVMGIAASTSSIGFAAISEYYHAKYLAIGLSLNNSIITLVTTINAPVIGVLIDYSAHNHSPMMHDLHFAFNFIIALVATSILFPLLFITESFCKSRVQFTVLKLAQ